ncbi:type II toxin-antitoxin system RelE/ParE family toxin [Neptuniibacter sp.]|uniref:type II toxin-antitoxin system RelE/ParE family toxin n=1 Tax=Neptuniibacter sp. TaxID=1962643 RepID=UPI0026124A3D|nr:type II toxin-antitoxin system RelE/ParE family toxin [Neptuniibacter sp.]MCP4595742.1 hypothetical protein [Neptuniibacter sp.]
MPIPVVERKAKEYETEEGKAPFKEWMFDLKDVRAKTKVTKAITRMEAGNFGDHKAITDGNGLHEHRIDYGPGYRIYYITEGGDLIILFAGSDKSDQQAAINKAKDYHQDYLSRKPKQPNRSNIANRKRKKKTKRKN